MLRRLRSAGLPLWLTALFVVPVGYRIQATRWWSGQSPHLFSVMLLAMPAIMGLEHVGSPAPQLLKVNSAVEVDALPETVWKQVVAFPELPRPDEWLFRLGIA